LISHLPMLATPLRATSTSSRRRQYENIFEFHLTE
jgi:hypothetical protein